LPADSVAARVNAERVSLLAWSRAILLQLAHPLVAAGIDDHSTFRASRVAAAGRLHHTVRAMLSLTFGSDAAREATLATINGIHRRVNGTLREAAGPFPAGTRYSAEDPALLLWVHATLVESIPLVYERVVRPLSIDERDEYCREAAWLPGALGAPVGAPLTWSELQDYVARMHESGVLVVSGQARELARAVMAPPLATLIWPAAYLNRLITVGLLPSGTRTQYGYRWSPALERRMDRAFAMLRAARRVTPDVLALWPQSRI
jgi:uncharacterized protein (DUF2236 family)